MRVKKLLCLIGAVSTLISMPAFAGSWQMDNNGWWWRNDDGSYPTSSWQWLDGNGDSISECYYFNSQGYMLSGTTTSDGYNVDANGAWVVDGVIQTKSAVTSSTGTVWTQSSSGGTGGVVADAGSGTWVQDSAGWMYRFDSGAYARSQPYLINGATYGFNQDGHMATGWYQYNSTWYYLDPASGAAHTGWDYINGAWYYLEPAMQTGWLDLQGKRYYLNNSGVMQTGWFTVEDDPIGYRYRAHDDGSLYRNETSTESGISFKYRSDGTIMYKTALTEVSGSSDSNTGWTTLLSQDTMEQVTSAQVFIRSQEIEFLKTNYVEDYYANIYGHGTTVYNDWVENVRTKLAKTGDTDESIESFLKNLRAGEYRKDGYLNDEELALRNETDEDEEEDYY